MAKLRLIEGKGRKRVLVYGMRLFEPGMLAKVNPGDVVMADGRRSRITFHIIEGSVSQIKKQLATSVDAFFDLQKEMKD
ncbi:MAG: allantoinase [Candidatus Binatia bacterium]